MVLTSFKRPNMSEKDPINFIETRFHFLSPFSAHRIEIWGEVFHTVEHAYQSARLIESPEREEVKNSTSPLEAWRKAQVFKKIPELKNEKFDKNSVMEELFRAKMAQHPDIVNILKESEDRELLKVYATDYYWGTGEDGSGENKMGKLWMKLRKEITG